MLVLKSHTTRGFTIVELLIVIVVISILAAISVVAYTGIQERARSSSMVSAVNQYAKAIEMYRTVHGVFPPGDWVCLGNDASDYPAANGYASGACHKGGTYNYPGFSSVVRDALLTQTSNLADPIYQEAPNEFGGTMRGLLYDNISSHTQTATITYYLEGNKDCPIGKKVYYWSSYNSTRCNYVQSK